MVAANHLFNYPEKSPLVIIRKPLIQICVNAPNSKCAGAVLGVFEYWTCKKPKVNQNLPWIYKTQQELREDLFELFSIKMIRLNVEWLLEQDLLERRMNPKSKLDRTYQYRINHSKITTLLVESGFNSQSADRPTAKGRIDSFQSANRPIAIGSSSQTIPETTTESTTEITAEKTILSHHSTEGDDTRVLTLEEAADKIYGSSSDQEISTNENQQAEVVQAADILDKIKADEATPAIPPTPDCWYINFREIESVYPKWRKDKSYVYIGGRSDKYRLKKSPFAVPKAIEESNDPMGNYRNHVLSCWGLRKALPELSGKILIYCCDSSKNHAPVLLSLLAEETLPPPPEFTSDQRKAGENCLWFKVRQNGKDITPTKDNPPISAQIVYDGTTTNALKVAREGGSMWVEMNPRKFVQYASYGLRVTMNDKHKKIKRVAFQNAWRGRMTELDEFSIEKLVAIWSEKGDHDLKGPNAWLDRLVDTEYDSVSSSSRPRESKPSPKASPDCPHCKGKGTVRTKRGEMVCKCLIGAAS